MFTLEDAVSNLLKSKSRLEIWKEIYEKWDLRFLIIFSLFLQSFLILAGPLRRRTVNPYLIFFIWVFYLLADYVANYSLGLIAKSQFRGLDPTGPFQNPNLLALWAPFLLVHLGGPDTITAYSLQDNELWLRHLFSLVFQTGIAVFVFILTLATKNRLWFPTLLMFVSGFIKYAERTQSFYQASVRRFRESLLTKPDPGPNYAKLMEEYYLKMQGNLPTKIEMIPEPQKDSDIKFSNPNSEESLTDLEIIQTAHEYFQKFKGLIADLIFSFRERNQSKAFFLKRTAKDAFTIVEVELNLFFDILYTKAVVIQGPVGYLARFVSLFSIVSAFCLFKSQPKSSFHSFDVKVTYLLLVGGIVLDCLSLFMLIRSVWTAVAVTKAKKPNWFMKFIRKLLLVNRKRWPFDLEDSPNSFHRFMGVLFYRRWSQVIPQYNLIHYCLNQPSKFISKSCNLLGLTNIHDRIKYETNMSFNVELRKFIFEQLQNKSEDANDPEISKEIYSSRGEWVLRTLDCSHLLGHVTDVDYDESLVTWHIATDLCYYTVNEETGDGTNKSDRKICKLLSDYMLYLLIRQSSLLSALGGIGEIRYRDTCAEALEFFKEKKENASDQDKSPPNPNHKEACEKILEVFTEVKPVTVKGDKSKSVLFDACILAKQLKDLEGKKWEVMSKVWVELLCYAACNCRAYTHAAQLSNGGQLISLVWLLMAHLGLGNQFQISEGHARAKLIEGK